MTTTTDTARDQAKAQLDHIRELMQWLEHASGYTCNDDDCTVELKAANDYTGEHADPHDSSCATEAIHENALSVEVRDGWYDISNLEEPRKPREFSILLCTGGPAVRITGELDEYGQPKSARLEFSDWGTPWTEYGNSNDDGECAVLLAFSQAFHFGG